MILLALPLTAEFDNIREQLRLLFIFTSLLNVSTLTVQLKKRRWSLIFLLLPGLPQSAHLSLPATALITSRLYLLKRKTTVQLSRVTELKVFIHHFRNKKTGRVSSTHTCLRVGVFTGTIIHYGKLSAVLWTIFTLNINNY